MLCHFIFAKSNVLKSNQKVAYMPLELRLLSDSAIIPLFAASRKAANISQREMAKRLNISQSMVHKIEHGNGVGRDWCRYLPKLNAWLRACGVQITYSFNIVEPGPNFENYSYNEKQRRIGYYKKRKEYQKKWAIERAGLVNLPENKPKNEI